MSFGVAVSKQLIETVQKYPELYDPRCSGYKDGERKASKWETIAMQFGLSSGLSARSKWKNLRDSYVKYMKHINPETLEPINKKYEKWPYAKTMDFLRPIIMDKKANPPATVPHLAETQQSQQVYVKFENYECDINSTIQSPDIAQMYADDQPPPKRVAVEENIYQPIRHLDATDLLFLSYAKTVKTFDKKLQTVTKMKVSQVIFEAELGSIEIANNSNSNM